MPPDSPSMGDSRRPAHLCTCAATPPVASAYHDIDCPAASAYDKQLWAADMLRDPKRAAVEMSGMSDADLAELRKEFG